MRRTPLLVWSNFPLARDSLVLGINTLESHILSLLGIPGGTMVQLSDSLRLHLPVVTPHFVIDHRGQGWSRDDLPPAAHRLLEDYRLLQYDLLMGEQYALPRRVTPDTASRPPC